MTQFRVIYLGDNLFSVRSNNGIELTPARRFDTLPEMTNWVEGFLSSWSSFSVDYQIDEFKKEQHYE